LGTLEDLAAANAERDLRPWWVLIGPKKYGPYTEAVMQGYIDEGRLSMETLYWREGMSAWQPISVPFKRKTPPPLPAQQPSVSATSLSSVDDPDRLLIRGSVRSVTGFPPMDLSHFCTLEFAPEEIVVSYQCADGNYRPAASLLHDEVTSLNIGGPGESTSTTGGGMIGGGFGVIGAAKGILLAGVFNALTTRSHTLTQTFIELYAGSRALLMVNWRFAPQELQILLAPVYARLNASHQKPGPENQSPNEDPILKIERLGSLRDKGLLSNEEFEKSKAIILKSMNR
jgi:hypothetical protein